MSLLETRQVCVAMAGDWSVAMAGRKTVKDSVRVRLLYCAFMFKHIHKLKVCKSIFLINIYKFVGETI